MDRELLTYFVLIQLKNDSEMERIARDVPLIIKSLSDLSRGEMQQVCRSNDGILFGFFVRTTALSHRVRIELEKCLGTYSGDDFLVLEISGAFDGLGFSRAWTWLQHHGK